jgi:GNAT superfamily N-acetyltransferase
MARELLNGESMENLSEKIEENMHGFHRLAGDVKDIGRALLFSNRSLPSASYNHATRIRVAEPEASRLIEDVIQYYQSMNVRACFMLYPTTLPASFADSLLKTNFKLIDEEQAMIFKRGTSNSKINSDVQIAEIGSAQLGMWTRVLMRGYGLPESFQGAVQEMFTKVSCHDGHRFYQATFNDNPVGSCLLYWSNDTATIYTVATIPEFTRKGVGTTLIKRAIADSSKLGCDILYLLVEKGSETERLYEKLGFEPVFTRRLYEVHP